jgi:hypothetical protein
MTPQQQIDDSAAAVMDALFAFKPGDIVIEKTHATAVIGEIRVMGKRLRGLGGVPMGVCISERVLKQCHGGIQGFYQCHERDGDRRGILTFHPTHAVMLYEVFIAAMVEAQNKAPADWGDWPEYLGIPREAIRDTAEK